MEFYCIKCQSKGLKLEPHFTYNEINFNGQKRLGVTIECCCGHRASDWSTLAAIKKFYSQEKQ